MKILREWREPCATCEGQRIGQIYHHEVAGVRYEATFPSRCLTKDKCEREIMRNYEITTDAERLGVARATPEESHGCQFVHGYKGLSG